MSQLGAGRPPIGSFGSNQARVPKSQNFKKAPPPKLGEAFGPTASSDFLFQQFMGGSGLVQFNLDKLDIGDYRQMKDHYQINASLSVLIFMMHQLDWKIVSDNQRVADLCNENMREIWTRLVRALSQAFWAGYS